MSYTKRFVEDLAVEYQDKYPGTNWEEAMEAVCNFETPLQQNKNIRRLCVMGNNFLCRNRTKAVLVTEDGIRFIDLIASSMNHPCINEIPEIKFEGYVIHHVQNKEGIWKRFLNSMYGYNDLFGYKKIIFHEPATIILWKDGTKTVVKCQNGEIYDKEKGIALCFMKRALGNKGNFNNVIKKAIQKESKNA